MPREDWNSYFLKIAEDVSTRATCVRRKVGAVGVNEYNRIVATGYNGPPSGFPHCTAETCIRTVENIPSGTRAELCYAVHAEQNLIIDAGNNLTDGTVYVTHQPCIICLKLMLAARIKCIVWKNPYNDPFSMRVMERCGSIFESPKGYTLFLVNNSSVKYVPEAFKICMDEINSLKTT